MRRMDTYEDRRQALLAVKEKYCDDKISNLAKELGKSHSYVSRMLLPAGNPNRKRIGEDMERHIIDVFGDRYLHFYHEIIAKDFLALVETTNVTPGPDVYSEVPLISWVQAGHWAEAVDLLQPGEGERIATTYRPRRHTYALRVNGDSMEPEFTAGDIVIVEPDAPAENGSYVIVRQNGGEATFKQLIQDGSQTLLKPLNPRYQILNMTDDAVICGVVKEKIKRY